MTETDPNGLDPHAPGAKLDAGKVMPWLCITGFAHALAAVADVTTKGARKYTPNGWATVQDGEQRYMEAFARHMLALGRGEQVDPDTQCLHKAQMIWNLLASLELELRKALGHERPRPDMWAPPGLRAVEWVDMTAPIVNRCRQCALYNSSKCTTTPCLSVPGSLPAHPSGKTVYFVKAEDSPT